MNLILLQHADFIDSTRVKLTGRRAEHACKTLKVTRGKSLQVGLLNGKTGIGKVLASDASSVEMDVNLEHEPPPPLPVTIILAMPRPKVFKRVLQGITAMGVKHIVLLNTWRVDKSYWQSPVLEPSNIRDELILGLEQGRDTQLPLVTLHKRFNPFVEDMLPTIAAGSCALVAHPVASQSCPVNLEGAITLAIGPEGGFTSYEIALLTEAGLTPVHLGKRPLRVETAVPALVGRLLNCAWP